MNASNEKKHGISKKKIECCPKMVLETRPVESTNLTLRLILSTTVSYFYQHERGGGENVKQIKRVIFSTIQNAVKLEFS